MSKIPRDPNHHTPPKGQRPAGHQPGDRGPSAAPSDASESNPQRTGLEGGKEADVLNQPGRGNGADGKNQAG